MKAKNARKSIAALAATLTIAAGSVAMMAGCVSQTQPAQTSNGNVATQVDNSSASAPAETQGTATAQSTGSGIDTSDVFSDRDMEQSPDLSSAERITLASNQDVDITSAGIYVLSGTAENVTVRVNAGDQDKVQLVLDSVSISNTSKPAIDVEGADKVFVTTLAGTSNSLSATDAVSTADGKEGAVVYSKDDITLNGQGTLEIKSASNGIKGNDDVKITGGTYTIAATNHGIDANDLLAVAAGTLSIDSGKDGLHCANDDEPEKGSVYIAGGTFDIKAGSDGIQASSIVQLDDGKATISAKEGIEGTQVLVNGGTVGITATDDGINATAKSSAYPVKIEIAGGNVKIDMGQGDTDALDANGDLIVRGGTVDITAQFAFDFDGTGELSGGTITVNGEKVTQITNSMMMMGGGVPGGNMPEGAMPGGGQGGFAGDGQDRPRQGSTGVPMR